MFDMSKCYVHDFSNGVDVSEKEIEAQKQVIMDYMIDNPTEPFYLWGTGNVSIVCVRCGTELEMIVSKNFTSIQPIRSELIKYRHSQKQMREIVDKLPAKIL